MSDQNESRPTEFRLVFEGREADDHRVAAAAVAQAVNGLQRAVYLVAMEHEKVDVRRREKTSRHLEEKYTVFLGPPEEGSLAFSAQIQSVNPEQSLSRDLDAVGANVRSALEAIERGDDEGVARIVSGRSRRYRLIETVRSMLPKPGSGLFLNVLDRSGQSVMRGAVAQRALPRLLEPSAEEPMKRSVTGRLVTIRFDERKLSILYRPTSRELECIYDETVEPFLLQHPRELISVTGQVVLDEENQPRRIVDVDEIVDVDLSAFYLSGFDYVGYALSFKEEVVIEPELDESEQLMVLKHEPLGIDVVGTTREELFQGLLDELDVLWRNYARADDSVLSPKALELKLRLRAAIEERSIAAR